MSDPKFKQLNLIVSKLKGVMRSGAGLVALCPAHEDKAQSLSINWKDDGTVLVKCHAGCETTAVMAAIDLPMSALFPEQEQVPVPSLVPPSERTEVCTYDYTDEKGNLLSQVVRLEPKSFRQRRPDGNGGWIYNLEGVRRVLYRLSELRKKHRTTAFIVEGEKDADRLWSLKLPTTTSLGGSSAWRAEYVEQLTAAKIERAVILPDNDGAGRKYAAKVAESLHAAGITVKIVELPGLPEKGDVSDWLDQGHTKEQLFELVKAAPAYDPAAPASEDSEPAEEVRDKRGRLLYTRLSAVERRKVQWLWPGRIPIGMITLIAGDPGHGKSFLTEHLASLLSRGKDWDDGAKSPGSFSTVFIAAEDALAEVTKPRCEAMGGDGDKIIVMHGYEGPDGKQRMISLEADIPLIREMLEREGAKLLVIDPINAYLGSKVDNYRDPEVRSVLTPMARMADELRIAIIGVMHLSKAQQAQVLYKIGGSVAFAALARAVFFVSRDKADRNLRLFTNAKMSIGKEADSRAYRIVPIDEDTARIVFEPDPVEVTASEAMEEEKKEGRKTKKDDAREWLAFFLQEGPKTYIEVMAAANEAGHKTKTVERASTDLKVVKTRILSEKGATGQWTWALPPKETK